MTRRVRFLVYKGFRASSPRDIKDALKVHYPSIKRLWLNHPEMTFNPRPGDVVINWGCSVSPTFWTNPGFHWLNKPDLVAVSGNRIKALTTMKEAGVNVPEFTTERAAAQQWLADGKSVLIRAELRSFGGRGITFRAPGDNLGDLPAAPLYTRYQPKKHEYRVHVFRGAIIDVQQKKRHQGDLSEGVESKIRSYANGWIFTRDGVAAPDCVRVGATSAVRALGLDFAAVDVGWTEKGNIATVYECNSAPGLKESSISIYANAIHNFIRGL